MVEFKIGERVIVSDEASGINGKGIIKDFDAALCKVTMDTGICIWVLRENVRDYKEDYSVVKVGDTVVSVSDTCSDITIGNKYVVTAVYGECFTFRDDGGFERTRLLRDYRVIPSAPPQKIQQDGYEYELVGPVKPDWLVDEAWVVRKDNGETHQISQKSENMFSATSSFSRVTGLTAKRVSEEFRPHTASDWKWGDWAMYEGKRVFVMSSLTHDNLVGVSFPNIDGKDLTDPSDQWDFAEVSELTPTF